MVIAIKELPSVKVEDLHNLCGRELRRYPTTAVPVHTAFDLLPVGKTRPRTRGQGLGQDLTGRRPMIYTRGPATSERKKNHEPSRSWSAGKAGRHG